MSRSRALISSLWLACVAYACTDDSGPLGSGRAVALDVRPSFQIDPALFPSAAVDRIRLAASDASTGQAVGTSDVQVSPTAAQWTLSLGIDLEDAPSRDVVVDVELLAGDVVQWSGRVGPITVLAGAISPAQDVSLYRGPLDNLDVVSLAVAGAPAWITVGATAVLVANPTLVAGSDVTPSVYWASTDPAVATVSAEGLVATVTGVAAGTTRIVTATGALSNELDLEVHATAPPGTRVWIGGDPAGPGDWHNPANWNPAGLPGPSDAVLIPTEHSVVLSADATVAGLTLQSSAVLDQAGSTLTVTGDLDAVGLVRNGLVDVAGPGALLQGYVDSLRISAPRAATGTLYLTGDLSVPAELTVGPHLVELAGNLRVEGTGGMLVMGDPASYVYVGGGATFDGADHGGLLKDGLLVVLGDFTVGSTNASIPFRSSGTTVDLAGSADQTVFFPAPSPGEQAFQDLIVTNTGGRVLLASNVPVEGAFTATGATLARAALRTTPVLELYGSVSLDKTTFDGLPVRISTSAAPGSLWLSEITFTAMPTNETQLSVAVPGAGLASPLLIQRPVFDTPPQSGFYYLELVNPTQLDVLEVQVTNPTPANRPAEILTSGAGLVTLVWPYP